MQKYLETAKLGFLNILILFCSHFFLQLAKWVGTFGTKGRAGLSHKQQGDIQWVGLILGEVTSSQFTSEETVGLQWTPPEKMSFASIQTAKKICKQWNVYVHGMRICRVSAETRHVLHMSAQRGFWLLYNSAMGPPCSVLELYSEVPPAFLLICLTTAHRCLRVLQMVGVGTGVLSWSEEQRLSRRACPEIGEGRTQTQIPPDELPRQLWLSKCEGC